MIKLLFIVLYLAIGILLAFVPLFIDRGILKYDEFYEESDKDNYFYNKRVGSNTETFTLILFFWPVIYLAYLSYIALHSVGKFITDSYNKKKYK